MIVTSCANFTLIDCDHGMTLYKSGAVIRPDRKLIRHKMMLEKQINWLLFEICYCICEVFDFCHLDAFYYQTIEPLLDFKWILPRPKVLTYVYQVILNWADQVLLHVSNVICLMFDFCRLALFLYMFSLGCSLLGVAGLAYLMCTWLDSSLVACVKLKMPVLHFPVFIAVSRNKTNYE